MSRLGPRGQLDSPSLRLYLNHEKTNFLKAIEDPELRESTRHRLTTKEALGSAAWASKEVPPAPKSLDNLDLTLINRPASKTSEGIDVGDYLLAQELNYGVILLGTAPLAKAFSRSRYKSMDAKLKICPQGMLPSAPVPGSSKWSLSKMHDGRHAKEKQESLQCGMQND